MIEVVASAIETLQKQISAIFVSIEIASKRQAYIDRLSSHLDLLAATADQHSLDGRTDGRKISTRPSQQN